MSNFGRFVAQTQTKPTAKQTGKTAGNPTSKGANAAEYTVSELSGAIKRTLEDGFGYIRLRGEISGYRGPHASGHCYFALKDERARIEAVIWRGVFSKLRVKPEEGMDVIATGKVSSYPGSSKYQIVIDGIEPAGLGAMMAELEERKKRLNAEGLFDDARKKPIPFLPTVVGVITSPTGAVIRDILAGFTERFPTHVVVWPVKVQGEGSAEELTRAITGMNQLDANTKLPKPDILIVARGGGSLEDLWSFNDEAVVRAAAASTIPLIAAVGHETDWTLIDLVADARAPTPTKAAEWSVPKFTDLVADLADRQSRLRNVIRRRIDTERTHLKAAARGIPKLEDLVRLPRQRFDMLERRLAHGLTQTIQVLNTRVARVGGRLNPATIRQRLSHGQQRYMTTSTRLTQTLSGYLMTRRTALDAQGKLLHSLGYKNVLTRGYALVRDANGKMVRRADDIAENTRLDIEFADGHVAATAGAAPSNTPTSKEKAAPKTKPSTERTKQKSTKPRDGGQGSLF